MKSMEFLSTSTIFKVYPGHHKKCNKPQHCSAHYIWLNAYVAILHYSPKHPDVMSSYELLCFTSDTINKVAYTNSSQATGLEHFTLVREERRKQHFIRCLQISGDELTLCLSVNVRHMNSCRAWGADSETHLLPVRGCSMICWYVSQAQSLWKAPILVPLSIF